MNVYSMKNWGESANFVGRDFLTIFSKCLFCLIYTFSSELGRKNNLTFYVNSHIYPKGEFTYEREKKDVIRRSNHKKSQQC